MKVLFDTNVIIDALAAREPFRVDAEAILTLAAEDKITGYVTGSALTDIYYLLRRGLAHEEAIEAIKTLMAILNVVAVGEDECQEAAISDMRNFEDAVVTVCAARIQASRDKEFASAGGPVPVLSPTLFLKKWKI